MRLVYKDCRFCKGTGELLGKKCKVCKGEGQIPVKVHDDEDEKKKKKLQFIFKKDKK